jgi:hypothetical protein
VSTSTTNFTILRERTLFAFTVLLLLSVRSAAAQQPYVDISGAVQIATGDEARLGGQHQVEPDVGIKLFDPGFRFGRLLADVSLTRRDDQAVIGRGLFSVDELNAGGLTWSVSAGDVWASPVVPDFTFPNLFAPPVTMLGGKVVALSPATSILIAGGRVTALRNIFGTDTFPIGQDVYEASASHRRSDRLDLQFRLSSVRGANSQPYTTFADSAAAIGGGARYRPHTSLELVADAGYTRYRRHGSSTTEQAPSGIVGALLALPKGWLQLNAQYLPLGVFPVFNYPYIDRSGIYAAGEYSFFRRLRLFAGAEFASSDLSPRADGSATAGVPDGTQRRVYGSVSVLAGSRSSFTVRAEDGGRDIHPSDFGPGFVTDTSVLTAEWHGGFSGGNTFLRYERRDVADVANPGQGFVQHDAMGQAYFRVRSGAQVFAQAVLAQRIDEGGTGQSLWQAGGGSQVSFSRSYLRFEANVSRTTDRLTGAAINRQMFSAGFSSQVTRQTYLSVDCYADRTPVAAPGGSPWVTRTMVRVTRSFPFGTSRSSQPAGEAAANGPSGRISGIVYVDWDGNGQPDPGEEPVTGVAVSLGRLGSVASGSDGRFLLTGVPVGSREVALDLATVPASYDPPAESQRVVDVARNRSTDVAFGLLPTSYVDVLVYEDTDGNGQLSAGDAPLDGAVVVLDDGARTEVSRAGRARFDAIRFGPHSVTALVASLPDGALLAGPPTMNVELLRDQDAPQVVFLIKLEKRPEIRKVFPPKRQP